MADKWFTVVGRVVRVDDEKEIMWVEENDGGLFLRAYCHDYEVVYGKDPEMVGVGDAVKFDTCFREQEEYRNDDPIPR